MEIRSLAIPDVKLISPTVHGDHRGYFFESYRHDVFEEQGIPTTFRQDNQSKSSKGILRGLHLQTGDKAQAKLVRAIVGEIFDVAVDVRPDSATFGQWVGAKLSDENHQMLFVPQGFAHGFLVTSETAIVAYKCDNYYAPEAERCLAWNDPSVNINWDIDYAPTLSAKDQQGLALDAFKTL